MTKAIEKLYNFHGVSLEGDEELIGDCPSCHARQRFYVDASTGKYNCKVCDTSGNPTTFLTDIVEAGSLADPSEVIEHREEKAGWPEGSFLPKKHFASVLERAGLFSHPFIGNCWCLPIFTPKVANQTELDPACWVGSLRNYQPGMSNPRFFGTPKNGPIGRNYPWINLQARQPINPNKPPKAIWITEGEWDGFLLDWLLNYQTQDASDWVLAAPGAGASLSLSAYARAAWASEHFGIPLHLVFDNDKAGKSHQEKLQNTIESEHPSAHVYPLVWNHLIPSGYDLTDAICSPESNLLLEQKEPKRVDRFLGAFKRLLADSEKTHKATPKKEKEFDLPPLEEKSFNEILPLLAHRGIQFTEDLEDALLLSGAVVLSAQAPGTPLWTLLVGSPASGKTLIMMMLDNVQKPSGENATHFESSINRKSLASGFAAKGGDPSVFGKITNPSRCLILKEYTTILGLEATARKEMDSILRDAFDGSFKQTFANGVIRTYEGQFGILGGVTHTIHKYNDSELGSRFLRFELGIPLNRQSRLVIDLLTKQAENVEGDENIAIRRRHIQCWINYKIKSYIAQEKKEENATLEEAYFCGSLACWVAISRATVERHRETREPLYRPQAEMGARVGKQLLRLLRMLRWVAPPEFGEERLRRLVSKVAWDTGWSRKAEVLQLLFNHPDDIHTTNSLADEISVPKSTIERSCKDLYDLEVLEMEYTKQSEKKGRPVAQYLPAEGEYGDMLKLACDTFKKYGTNRSLSKESDAVPRGSRRKGDRKKVAT